MKMNIVELLPSSASNKKSLEYYLKKNYVEIFKTLFPDNDKDRNGKDLKEYTCTDKVPKFTERNLTVNFAEAVKKCYPGAVCWYEFPFQTEENTKNEEEGESSGEEHNKHFDAVIVSQGEGPFVLVCEAKRDFPERGLKVITDDIQRIQKYGRGVSEAVSNGDRYTCFGVILLDGWTDDSKDRVRLRNTEKTDYRKFWKSNGLVEKLINEKLGNAKDKIPEKHAEFHIYFSKEQTVHKTIREQYTIKVIVWEIAPQ